MRIITKNLFLILAALFNSGAYAQDQKPEVFTIKLKFSNAHVIRQGANIVLIDAGSKGDLPKLEKSLAEHGIKLAEIKTIILSHGHSDHAGLSAELRRRSGAQVILGRGDEPLASAGHNDDLQPRNFTAFILKKFAIDPSYEAFSPDVFVENELDLSQWGLSGRVFQMPGHTKGSLVVELTDGRAFIGDMILGGYLGGLLFPTRPGEHYFHADANQNLLNILALLKRPMHTFYLGHGGPVTHESVQKVFGRNN